MRKYAISYDVKPLTGAQAEALGRGACDGLLIISVVRGKDGSVSLQPMPIDLEKRELVHCLMSLAELVANETEGTRIAHAARVLMRDVRKMVTGQ